MKNIITEIKNTLESSHPKPSWRAPRLADCAPTAETPAGRPHLKPQVGAHPVQWLAALRTGKQLWIAPAPKAHSLGSPTHPRSKEKDRPRNQINQLAAGR